MELGTVCLKHAVAYGPNKILSTDTYI